MKLEESFGISVKRKWDCEHTDRKSKRSVWNSKVDCDIDVLQAQIRATTLNQKSASESIRLLHAVTYPVNCDPIDGLSPNHYVMQVRHTSCPRCLQGEAGHFGHILKK